MSLPSIPPALIKVQHDASDPGTPYYSLLHPMWATHYGTYDHLARVQEWSLVGDDEEDEISPRISSRAGP